MASTFCIIGFKDYVIVDKQLYRKSFKVRMKNGNFQYRRQRLIEKTNNNGIEGYILTRNGKRQFYSLERLRHKLKKLS